MGQFWLEFDNQGSRQRFDFNQMTVSIGRDPSSDFHLDHPTVSRQHALIVDNRGGHQLVVLSKSGLTAINGQAVNGTIDLRPGQLIQLGELQFIFQAAAKAELHEPATEQFDLAMVNPGGDSTAPMPAGGGIGHAATAALPSVGGAMPANVQSGIGFQAVGPGAQQQSFGSLPPSPNGGQNGFGSSPPPGQQGFGSNPAGAAGFGSSPPGQQAGFGSSPPGGFGQPAVGGAPPPGVKKPEAADGSDEFKIPSWDTIAAQAVEDDAQAKAASNFERIQEAQRKAAKNSGGSNPAVLAVGVIGIAGMMYFLFFHKPAQGPGPDTVEVPECARRICPQQAYTCAGESDCIDKAKNAYKVADELYQKKGANITNLFEAYKLLDKADVWLEVGGVASPPPEMKDYKDRMAKYEKELDAIANDHRIRFHQLQQRKMYDEMAETVDSWMAYFPDKSTKWWEEAINKEREMKDRGTWPKKRLKKKK